MSGPEHPGETEQISYVFWEARRGWSRQVQQNFINVVINIVIMIIVTYREVHYWRSKQLYFAASYDFVYYVINILLGYVILYFFFKI
jgi:hypothetical protein